jgi:hypothetical protein
MPQNLHELKIYIQDACESVDMKMLSSDGNEIIILTCVESSVELTLKSDVTIKTLKDLVYALQISLF